MQTPTKIYYNPSGVEAVFLDGKWTAIVRGYVGRDGKFVERGGPANPDDKPLVKLTLTCCNTLVDDKSVPPLNSVRETFLDALADHRDLLGRPIFRNKPKDAAERRLFAIAYDAAQKIRSKMNVLDADKLIFIVDPPALFAYVDCFAHDSSGAFWLMNIRGGSPDGRIAFDPTLPLAAYILERGEYVPYGALVRLGVWTIAPTGLHFTEIPNDRVAARDAIIAQLSAIPF